MLRKIPLALLAIYLPAFLAVAAQDSVVPSFKMFRVSGSDPSASVRAYALSDRGHVLGLYGDVNRRVFVFHPYSGMAFLPEGTLYPSDVNNHAYAVGGSFGHWLFAEGTLSELNQDGTGDVFINNQFQAAGNYHNGSFYGGFFQKSVKQSEVVDLGHLGGYRTEVNGMNDHGDVVGSSKANDGDFYAFVYTAENGMETLDVDPGFSDKAEAYAINDRGDIVAGNRVQMFYFRAATGERETMRLPQVGVFSSAKAVNKLGQVIGGYAISGPETPFFWWNGESYDLADLVTNLPADQSIVSAVDINERGQILVQTAHQTTFQLQTWVLVPQRTISDRQ